MQRTNHFVPYAWMRFIAASNIIIECIKDEVASKRHDNRAYASQVQSNRLFPNGGKSKNQPERGYREKTKNCYYKTRKVCRLKQKIQSILLLRARIRNHGGCP